MSHSTQTIDIRGSGNTAYLAYGDVNVAVLAQSQFSPTDLADVQPPEFKSPPITDRLVGEVHRSRLLVLGGHGFEEKTVFARHLAWRLKDVLSRDDTEISVQLWHPSSEAQSLENAFDGYDAPTVFVFLSLQPHHLAYDLRRLFDSVKSHHHYAIVATDSELSQWESGSGLSEAGIWQNLGMGEVYDEGFLVRLLREHLKDVCGDLPESEYFLPDGLVDDDARLVGELSLREAARRLETPSRVRSFVSVLASDRAKANEVWVLDKLEQLSGRGEAVSKWYRQLGGRDQLLTVGLAFFDGLFDDQVFAALEVLVNTCWRRWDPSLAHFDYHDLERVRAYFRGGEAGISRIEWSPEHRRDVFAVAWRLHRRRLLATLPWLVRLVKDSAHGPSLSPEDLETLTSPASSDPKEDADLKKTGSDEESRSLSERETRLSRWYEHGPKRDLFGSPIRAAQLRHAVAETLGQLAYFSVEAVERSLLDLAEDGRRDVQAVAAMAMAGWRATEVQAATGGGNGTGKSQADRLFRTLSAWQNEAFWKELSQRLHRRHRTADAFAHIRATVALAMGYAAQYDPPTRPEEKLVRLLEKFFTDRHPTVRNRFCNPTLPIVVAWHFEKIEGVLRNRALEEDDLLLAVATGIGFAFLLRPEETKTVLERWLVEARDLPQSPAHQRSRREKLLVTVALAYGCIRQKERSGDDVAEGRTVPGAVDGRQVFEMLQQILATESHPFVRNAVLLAMTFQTEGVTPEGLRQVEPALRRFLREVTLEERKEVVDWLRRLYLKQRRELGKEGDKGDGEIQVDGVTYRVWAGSRRPQTLVEKLLYSWLRSSGEPAAQQVAMEAFAAFVETPLERRERAWTGPDEDAEDGTEEAGEDLPVPAAEPLLERLHRGAGRERLALFCATFFASRYRRIVEALLAEYLALRKGREGREDGEETLTLVLKRFEGVEDRNVRETVRYLRRAIRFHAWGWRLLGALLFVLSVVAGVGGYFVLR